MREAGAIRLCEGAFARSCDRAAGGGDARLLAGGQSLIATLNMRLSARACWSTSTASPGSTASRAGRLVEIGALVRHVAGRALGRDRAPCAADREGAAAYRPSGDPQPRHHRRLDRVRRPGGRAAGLPARARRRGGDGGPQGARSVKADDFFKGLFETALTPRDVLTAIRVPAATPTPGSALPSSRAATATMRWRARRLRARRRQGPARRPARLFRRRRDAGPRARRRGGARRRRRRRRRRGAGAGSRPARRRAGNRRGEEASRRRAAAAGHAPTDGVAIMSERIHDIARHRERRGGARARRCAQDAGRFPARGSRAHRQPCRMRARGVRRLHGAG